MTLPTHLYRAVLAISTNTIYVEQLKVERHTPAGAFVHAPSLKEGGRWCNYKGRKSYAYATPELALESLRIRLSHRQWYLRRDLTVVTRAIEELPLAKPECGALTLSGEDSLFNEPKGAYWTPY